ncbi:hypothetical protein ACLKA6_010093 [Drosophila palustris]
MHICNPDGTIPRSQWKWVETALAIRCFEMLEKEPGLPPVCKDIGWYQGTVKVIACDDNSPSMPTHDWRVAKIDKKPGPTHQAVLILNKESLAPFDAVGGELNFWLSSVFIRVYKSDAPAVCCATDRPVEEDITSEIEAPEHQELDGYTSDASTIKNLWQAGDMEFTTDVASDDDDSNATVVETLSRLFPTTIAISPRHRRAFLDIEGAFNNVFPEAITEALTDLEIESRLVGLINQMLKCRAVTSTIGSSTLTSFVSRGTPQGGVLPPLLWNLVVNKLFRDIEGEGCQIVAYAYEVAVIFTGK